jgi:hypothetical protein
MYADDGSRLEHIVPPKAIDLYLIPLVRSVASPHGLLRSEEGSSSLRLFKTTLVLEGVLKNTKPHLLLGVDGVPHKGTRVLPVFLSYAACTYTAATLHNTYRSGLVIDVPGLNHASCFFIVNPK